MSIYFPLTMARAKRAHSAGIMVPTEPRSQVMSKTFETTPPTATPIIHQHIKVSALYTSMLKSLPYDLHQSVKVSALSYTSMLKSLPYHTPACLSLCLVIH